MRTGHQAERFPQSALLFKFCVAVLQKRNGTQKVHDQDIGNVLHYNASDTSHWKRGKKEVKSVHALEALARKLEANFETLHDITDGTLDFEEAWFEFCESEALKDLSLRLSAELQQERAQRMAVLETLATQLLLNANITTIPVFLPEVVTSLPFIEILARDVGDKLARSIRSKPGVYSIHHRKGDMRAHTRVAISREIARIVLHSERIQFGLPPRIDELLPFEIEHFSNALLAPMSLLKQEFQKIPTRLDATAILADTFWVPKSVIRARITQAIVSIAPTQQESLGQLWVNRRTNNSSVEVFDLSEDDVEESHINQTPSQTLATLN